MPTVLNWPERGEWLLANPVSPIGHNEGGFYRKSDPPFAVLTVTFRSKSGTVRYLKTSAPINNIRLRQTAEGPKFSASYAICSHSGTFEATVFDKYELEIAFTGTVVTSVNAHPTDIVGGDTSVASLSTQDKLQEAIRRALPLMPAEVRHEVEALFTPQAIAVMAGLAALWAASHLAVVGWIADLALLLTGGILLGAVAWEVGNDLAAFMTGAVGASTQEELDEAARRFAAAVLKGGVLLVGTILMSKRPGRGSAAEAKPPVRTGELPTENNMVPPSRIPPPARMPPPPQGEQPRLAGLPEDVAQLVRAVLNKIRRADLEGKGIDCCAGSEALDTASGNRGLVRESTSGASSPAGISDHTMWEIGGEFVDTRPGWWRDLFRASPGARAALNRLIPGLAERLENGAVLTAAEHRLYQSGGPTPRSPMFDGKPVPRPGGPRPAGG